MIGFQFKKATYIKYITPIDGRAKDLINKDFAGFLYSLNPPKPLGFYNCKGKFVFYDYEN